MHSDLWHLHYWQSYGNIYNFGGTPSTVPSQHYTRLSAGHSIVVADTDFITTTYQVSQQSLYFIQKEGYNQLLNFQRQTARDDTLYPRLFPRDCVHPLQLQYQPRKTIPHCPITHVGWQPLAIHAIPPFTITLQWAITTPWKIDIFRQMIRRQSFHWDWVDICSDHYYLFLE